MRHIVKFIAAPLVCVSLLTAWTAQASEGEGGLSWPAVNGDKPQGLYPNLDDLRMVRVGLGKDQVRGLIGSPHFLTGMFGVREWDYLFRFRADGRDAACQYKVVYGRDKRVSALHWKDPACESYLREPAAAVQAAQAKLLLPADALFAFNRWAVADILPNGAEQLRAFAAQFKAADPAGASRIQVSGYADRIGSDADNQLLSHRRADTVREFLIGNGIDAARISASGHGESGSRANCDGSRGEHLIACLAPDRRVEIEVVGAAQG